jgi:hypothetical protein
MLMRAAKLLTINAVNARLYMRYVKAMDVFEEVPLNIIATCRRVGIFNATMRIDKQSVSFAQIDRGQKQGQNRRYEAVIMNRTELESGDKPLAYFYPIYIQYLFCSLS